MLGADATIAWIDRNGRAQAQDYYLSGYVQVLLMVPYFVQRYIWDAIIIFIFCAYTVSWRIGGMS